MSAPPSDRREPLRVLHLEDDATDLMLVADYLRGEWHDCRITAVSTGEAFGLALREAVFDVILSDFTLGGFDGMSALLLARAQQPDTPFIFLSGTIGEDLGIEAMRNGASDYVIKDRPKRLIPAIKRAMANARDVRERRTAEERLLRVQRLENIGMLAAGIAHDFNNVLAPVLMAGQLLRERLHDPMDLRILDNVEQSAQRGAGLVRQILGFATGATGAPHLVQPKHLIAELISVLRQTFPASIIISDDIAPELWPLKVNPTHLHQVLLNLCINSRDAMGTGGTLRIRAENRRIVTPAAADAPDLKPGGYLCFEVQDTGGGVPPEIISRIWEPFYTTKGEGRGTGLGLSTVRGIVEDYGGCVILDNRPGHGATFRVLLPGSPHAEADHDPTAEPNAPRGNGELILVADKDPAVRDVTAATLTRYGYRVLVAADGGEALALYAPRSFEIRAVVADLNMPDVGGLALVKVLRNLNPSIRVLATSGLGEQSGRQTQTPFIAKPFTRNALLFSLRELLLLDEPSVRQP